MFRLGDGETGREKKKRGGSDRDATFSFWLFSFQNAVETIAEMVALGFGLEKGAFKAAGAYG